jgi:LPXTG-motif cell wall-anchored protein
VSGNGRGVVKKVWLVLLGMLALLLFSALPAFAQSDIPPEVGGEVVAPPGDAVVPPGAGEGAGIAFTGATITMWMVLMAALLVLGIAFLVAARRRSRSAGT